jgi:hypothetical protein
LRKRAIGTRFAKIVVTDDFGRYVLPDLPKARYRVWVRGYGLIDSKKIDADPGKTLNLTAEIAPDLAHAAQYYPAIYWFSLLHIPDKNQFPGTGPNGNGIPDEFKTQDQWLDVIKTNSCGNGATELSTDDMPVLDPVRNAKSVIRMPVRDGEGTPSSALANPVLAPSAYFGTEQVWDSRANAHTPVMDQDGRVYFTAQSRPPNAQPAYCGKTRRCVRRSSIR